MKVSQLGREILNRTPKPKLGIKKVKAITPRRTNCSYRAKATRRQNCGAGKAFNSAVVITTWGF